MTAIADIDAEFEEPPLMLALAQVIFTQSPEIFQGIVTVKEAMANHGMPVAQSRPQVDVAIDPRTGAPLRVAQNLIWWFNSLDKRRAIAVAQTSVVFYEANYTRFTDFSEIMRAAVDVVLRIAGKGCFLTTIAMRYVSGFASDGTPSPYLATGLHGLDVSPLNTDHFHQRYSFWCVTEHEGRLVLSANTVHGNQLVPEDLRRVDLRMDEKFALPKETNAVQLDIHETIRRKKLEPFSADEVARLLFQMRRNIKQAFLTATTAEAHKKWKLKRDQ